MYFFHQFHLLIQKFEKRIKTLGPLGWRADSNHFITCFFFSNCCAEKILTMLNHCAGTIKKIHFFSCWALYCKYVELNATFNLLLLFSLNLLYSTSIMLMIIRCFRRVIAPATHAKRKYLRYNYVWCSRSVFFFSILWCSWSGNHS